MMIIVKKKIILFALVIFLFVSSLFFLRYYNWKKIVDAASAMPWQDGGTISMVRPVCILDTPVVAPTTCAISCPLVTSVYGPACVGYTELDVVGQNGTSFIAVPIGFVYQGGGTMPVAGMQFIAGGSSNIMPWVIGIPSASASRMQKIADTFKLIIAGMRNQ